VKQGEGSGAGAVLGGVLGGVLGHQIGSGRGNTAATIVGAGAGAYAGNEVEKNRNTSQYWNVRVRFEDGTTQTLRYDTQPDLRSGDRVRVENGKVVSRG
jgi:outer membrane lipoprotein SlyB